RRRVKEEAGSTRVAVDPEEQRRVVDAFIAARAGGEIEALLPLLDPSVMGWADAGGLLPAVSRPNVGREQVAQSVMRFLSGPAGATLMARNVNGEPGIIALRDGVVSAVLALTVKDGLISRVYAVVDPSKLAHVQRALDRQQ
ncbi:MAG: RNA polymerase sigma-70 factor, partial [Chloroflexi bacterium]|nr:RNA polymerase sigma-70 factor [Chloroflexota bacterium]